LTQDEKIFLNPRFGLHVRQELPASMGALDLLKFKDYLDLERGPRKKGRGFDLALSVRDLSFDYIIPAMNGWAF
jgi:hypothetical protein